MKLTRTNATFDLTGESGRLARNIAKNWLIGLRETNPAVIGMFRDRDKLPYRDLLPWSGEFAGKYITGAYYIWRLTRDKALFDCIQEFIAELIGCIDGGYIGCYSRACRLTGAASAAPENVGATWDAWSHYHIMTGLFLWYGETGDESLLGAVKDISELFLSTFYNGKKRLADTGSTEMNLAPLHIFTLLHLETGDARYLDFALEIVRDLELPGCGDYIRHSENGLEYYQCPKPRWESLHIIMGIANLTRCTGDPRYLAAAEQIFYSILKTDIHNTGGFSTDEQAIGNPFGNGAIELCCVIAYNALAAQIYLGNGDPAIADFLELSHYNAVMGSYSPTGRWSTYNTPMEGAKLANYHHIVFQSRPGSPDMNCCSANSARGVGNLAEWAFAESGDTFYINFFEDCAVVCEDLSVKISGGYPARGEIKIRCSGSTGRYAKLAVRIPAWSKKTSVFDGYMEHRPSCGGYFTVDLPVSGAEFTVSFDFSLRYLSGGGEYAGKESIFRGPVLFGFDISDNDSLPENITLKHAELECAIPEISDGGRIYISVSGGVLTDFYHLGFGGGAYRTWVVVQR